MLSILLLATTLAVPGAVQIDPLESVMLYALEYEGGHQKLDERFVAARDLGGIVSDVFNLFE